jgi:hypothetical protein
MYNPATQVQVSIDANLGSYFQKKKIAVGDTLPHFLSNFFFTNIQEQKLEKAGTKNPGTKISKIQEQKFK